MTGLTLKTWAKLIAGLAALVAAGVSAVKLAQPDANFTTTKTENSSISVGHDASNNTFTIDTPKTK